MSQLDKLLHRVIKLDKKLRFDELAKILKRIGYTIHQPKRGSRHFTFRKDGRPPITIPKDNPISKVYVELVRDAILIFESEEIADE